VPYFRNETWPTVSFLNLKHYKFSNGFYVLKINTRGVTAKRLYGAIPIIDLSHYENYFSQT